MSSCRTCAADIIWVQDEETGRYHRPLERLDLLEPNAAEVLHARKLLVVIDGEVIQVPASGLYVVHGCPVEYVPSQRVEPPEQPVQQVGRSQAITIKREDDIPEPKQAQVVASGPSRSLLERYGWAWSVQCPKCGVEADMPCRNLNKTQRAAHPFTVHPHPSRVEYAMGTGLGNQERLSEYLPDRAEGEVMRLWLRANSGIFDHPVRVIPGENVVELIAHRPSSEFPIGSSRPWIPVEQTND